MSDGRGAFADIPESKGISAFRALASARIPLNYYLVACSDSAVLHADKRDEQLANADCGCVHLLAGPEKLQKRELKLREAEVGRQH